MCLIWNSLPTNYEYYRLCVLLGGVGIGMMIRPAYMVQEEPVGGNLSTASGAYGGNHRKA
jgi:hypothetical protein